MDKSILSKPLSCVACTTEIIGDKWTPLLLNALSEGEMRFCELQSKAGGLNPRTLSSRLDSLESKEIIFRHKDENLPHKFSYKLTKKGLDLLPVLKSMAQWGQKYSDN